MKLKIENIRVEIPVEVSDVKKVSDMQTKGVETRKLVAQILAEEMINRKIVKLRYSKNDYSKVIYARADFSAIIEEEETDAHQSNA